MKTLKKFSQILFWASVTVLYPDRTFSQMNLLAELNDAYYGSRAFVLPEPEGGYVICGTFFGSENLCEPHIFLARFASNGSLYFKDTIVAGLEYMTVCGFAQYKDGYLILVNGSSQADSNQSVSSFVIRVSQEGGVVWVGERPIFPNFGLDLKVNSAGVIFVCGGILVDDEQNDAMLYTLDSLGNLLWNVSDGNWPESEAGVSLVTRSSGSVMAVNGFLQKYLAFFDTTSVVLEKKYLSSSLNVIKLLKKESSDDIIVLIKETSEPKHYALITGIEGNQPVFYTLSFNQDVVVLNAATETNGRIILLGMKQNMNPENEDFFLAEVGEGGDIFWQCIWGETYRSERALDVFINQFGYPVVLGQIYDDQSSKLVLFELDCQFVTNVLKIDQSNPVKPKKPWSLGKFNILGQKVK